MSAVTCEGCGGGGLFSPANLVACGWATFAQVNEYAAAAGLGVRELAAYFAEIDALPEITTDSRRV